MTATKTYPLKIENLPKNIQYSEVRDFFDGPSTEVLQNMDIFNSESTSTAILVLKRPDVAYEFLNLKEPEIGGNRVTLFPELIEEMSITLNGSWLREIENENPAIQVDIQKIAQQFQLKLVIKKSDHGNTSTISLTGVPWRIKQTKAILNSKIEAVIKNHSSNVPMVLSKNPSHLESAGIQSGGNKRWDQSENVDNMYSLTEQRKPVLKLDEPQSPVDAKSDVGKIGSAELDNPGKKRERKLKAGDAKAETVEDVVKKSNRDIDVNQSKEGKRQRVLVSKPGEMQSSDTSVDALRKSSSVDYPVSTQFKAVISVDSDIHRYMLEHSTKLNFTDSSMTQFQVSEDHIDWVIGSNNETDLRLDKEDLRRIIDGLCKKSYFVPDEFDFDLFKNLIEASNENKNVSLIFYPKERICKIIGLVDEMERTYKWICDTAVVNFKRSTQTSFEGFASGDSKTYDKRSSTHQVVEAQSGSDSYCTDHKSETSGVGKKREFHPFPDPKQQMTKAGNGIRISKSSKDKLKFTTRGNLKVSVYQGNMIKQPTEVIVNPANDSLAHGGGLARVILDAGGPVIDDESRKIISIQGKLQTSEVVHTSAGRLSRPIKYVIHAVGPTAYEFKDNKAGLIPTMRITFRNCFEYANDKLGVSSISLPPISSGIFGVSIPDIIQGAFDAIQDFDRKYPSPVLKEVHIISNDAKTTEEMISCFQIVIG